MRIMTSDLDIYRTASALIREHGDEADLVAAQRADSFLRLRDLAARPQGDQGNPAAGAAGG